MKRHYSPNHPAVRSRQSNYHTPYLEPTVRERREAVRQRIGSRNNPRLTGWVLAIGFIVAVCITDKHPMLGIASLALSLSVSGMAFRGVQR